MTWRARWVCRDQHCMSTSYAMSGTRRCSISPSGACSSVRDCCANPAAPWQTSHSRSAMTRKPRLLAPSSEWSGCHRPPGAGPRRTALGPERLMLLGARSHGGRCLRRALRRLGHAHATAGEGEDDRCSNKSSGQVTHQPRLYSANPSRLARPCMFPGPSAPIQKPVSWPDRRCRRMIAVVSE